MPCDDCSRAETCPPCVNGENVRTDAEILNSNTKRELLDDVDDPQAAAWLGSWLDLYAHKLAEKQRAWLRFQGYDTTCICGSCSACLAKDYIDLIDPKAQT